MTQQQDLENKKEFQWPKLLYTGLIVVHTIKDRKSMKQRQLKRSL